MKKEILKVPRGIRYISEWKEFSLGQFSFPHIINKQITGCGFTEYCLTNKQDLILCSPRRILLENKEGQHRGDVFYFRNNYIDLISPAVEYDLDLNGPLDEKTQTEILKSVNNTTPAPEDNLMLEKITDLKRSMLDYIDHCHHFGRPAKILVTYDSFKLVRELIETSDHSSIYTFQIVVDEFQSIFTDSRFKSDTELNFLTNLVGLNRVCFVSATPMIDTYLQMLEEFKELPYYEFDWKSEDKTRVIKPSLDVKCSKSLVSDAASIVNSYLNGDFESTFVKNKQSGEISEIKSTEAVLYFNSVKNICDIIKKCKLTPDNTNILCANTSRNQSDIKKAFKTSCKRSDGDIGHVPVKGEPHKMFTFCTRTVYLGADFYSTNARSFIFSDPNVECLAVDISLDLPQILGRQRLEDNPWKNQALLFYKTLRKGSRMTQEELNATIKEKTLDTNRLIRVSEETKDLGAQQTLIKLYEQTAKAFHYKHNYLSVNRSKEGDLFPVFNNLVLVSEMRAFDIQQIDYKDRFSVFSGIVRSNNADLKFDLVEQLLVEFDMAVGFPQKMKILCTSSLPENEQNILLNNIPSEYKTYYLIVGPEKCQAFGYRRSSIDRELKKIVLNKKVDIRSEIYKIFEVGKKYSAQEIKEKLSDLYSRLDYNSTAKATDLSKYFELKDALITTKQDNVSKRIFAYEILSIKKEGED